MAISITQGARLACRPLDDLMCTLYTLLFGRVMREVTVVSFGHILSLVDIAVEHRSR
jgi:hypothetical protein